LQKTRFPSNKEVRKVLAKKTSKNQLTLPKEIFKEFPGIEYFDVSVSDGRIELTPVRITPADTAFEKIRQKLETLSITETDVAHAVRSARKRNRS
jgi:hypothetical protein